MPPLNDEREEEESLRDTISNAFRSGKSDGADAPVEDAPVEDAPVEDAPVAKEEGAPAKSEGDAEPADKAIAPPARWTKEEKEEFAALDPNVQRILMGRNKGLEADYTRKMTEISQERQRYNGIEQTLAPRRAVWQREGMNDTQALESIMSYWDLAQRDPAQFIDVFAQERGIDLASYYSPTPEQIMQMISESSGEEDQGQAIHPAVRSQMEALSRQTNSLQGEVSNYRNYMADQQHQQVVARTEAARNELHSFSSASDENGQSLYPFFEEVRKDMSRLMQSGMAGDLKTAYDMATRVNPSTWSKLQESQEISRRRAEQAKREEEAVRARRAGSSVSTGSSPAAARIEPDDDGMSLRDLIKSQFSQARSAGRV